MNSLDKNKITRAFFWVGVGSALSRGANMLSTFVLAAILIPDDFGIVSIAVMISNVLSLFRDFGVGQALIYQKEHVEESANTAFLISVGMGIFLYLVGFFLAEPAAVFFRNPNVEFVVKVLPFTLVISSFSSIPLSLLEKELDFRMRILPDIASSLAYLAITVVLAARGLGFWSIIFGDLAGSIVLLIVIFMISSWHPKMKLNIARLKKLVGFGKYMMTSTIIIFIYRNIDDFIIGRMLGMKQLGFYGLAYRIGNLPTNHITQIISKVLYPAFMNVRDDWERLVAYYYRSFRYLCFITFPVAFGILVFAPDFFHLLYGEKWNEAILPTQILAVFGLIRSLFSMTSYLFIAAGRVREIIYFPLGQVVLFCVFFYPVITRWGIVGICSLLTLLNAANAIAQMALIERFCPGVTKIKSSIMFSFLMLSTFAIVFPTQIYSLLGGALSLWLFIAAIAIVGGVYVLFVRWREPEMIGELSKLFREQFRRSPQ